MKFAKALLPAVLLGLAGAAVAAAPADIITARHAAFKDMGKAMKPMREELKGGSPKIEVFKANAPALLAAAAKLEHAFPKGTGPEAGVKTEALPVIWEKNADFTKLMGELQTKARALDAAAKGNDVGKVAAATQSLGETCKSCHQTFKKKD